MKVIEQTTKTTNFCGTVALAIWKWVKPTIIVFALLGATWFTATTVERQKQEEVLNDAVIHALDKAYGEFGVEVFTLAQMFVGEAKGQPNEWADMATAFFARVYDPRWADDVEHVAKKDCEIDSFCDHVPEYLNSEIGHEAIEFSYKVLSDYYAGTFVPTHTGHSWATPEAANGHAYFAGLEVVLQGSGHKYFGDRSLAPETSVHPKRRPAHPVQENAINQAVQVALSE